MTVPAPATFTILALAAVALAFGAWAALGWRISGRPERLPRAEKRARTLLSMAPEHPERLIGGEREAVTGDFASWGAELAEDGLDAGSIIADEWRGQS